ncbi:MAG TPA: adenosylcobinamide-GDP ribazoletransferase [Thermodesulfobacteriota bacterium]|nr:adenosylcobinamide-GDP ribazoletransferase [Thermodesulfobacteriota bacterium]
MTSFLLAWQFLTLFPGGKKDAEATPEVLGRSMAYYPLVGLLIGSILWAAYWVVSHAFPRTLCDGLAILLLVIITGALHLDGLADTLDGMAAGKSAEERLRIMRDHRVGTFGAVGLVLVLGIKFLALNSLPEEIIGKTLIAALALSRWSMVQLTYRAPYARPEGGLGKVFKENVTRREMALATAFSLTIAVFLLRFWGAVLWLAVGVSALGIQLLFQKKIGGITGDILGAANETHEVLVLVMVAGIFHGFF